MKKKYIGKNAPVCLLNGKVYEIISIERDWYRLIDETGEDYLYPPEFFVDSDGQGYVDSSALDNIEEHLIGEITDIEVIGEV